MNKKSLFLSVGMGLAVVCSVYVYANTSRIDETNVTSETEVVSIQTVEASATEKVLVAYFTSPETDGVDASSGASRVLVNGKLYGNTEYVATLISQKTGGDLFQIKTEQTYPGTHKELIDAAKKEADGKVRPNWLPISGI